MNTPLQDNIKAIAAALSSLRIGYAVVSYSGSGDSGDGYTVSYSDSSQGLLCGTTMVPVHTMRYDPSKGATAPAVSQMSVSAALEECTDQAIDAASHGGWENSEGGFGCFAVCASGYAVLEHNDNGEHKVADAEAYAFEPPADAPADADGPAPGPLTQAGIWRAVQPLAAALAAAGATHAELTYSGSDGSGDVESITCFNGANEEVDLSGVALDCLGYKRHYDTEAHAFVLKENSKNRRFEDGLADLFDFIVEKVMDKDGWEINEGASGTLNLFANGRLTVEHSDFVRGEVSADVTSWHDELRADNEQATGYGDES